jgi:hypothetical protein
LYAAIFLQRLEHSLSGAERLEPHPWDEKRANPFEVSASNVKPLPDSGDSHTGPTPAEILRGAAAGEAWAYAALYDALYPFVARALQKILHRTPDYEDLVQISFELIVRTLQKPRAEPIENLAAWASAIATRVALDSLRTRIRERRLFNRDTSGVRAAEVVARSSPGCRRRSRP